MSRFTNKIVVITGGTSGIGLVAARQFIKEGAEVVVTGRSARSVSDAQTELNANGIAIAADVTKSNDLESLFNQVREKYGQINVLVANAGIAKLGSVAETTEEVFDEIIDANFRGARRRTRCRRRPHSTVTTLTRRVVANPIPDWQRKLVEFKRA